MINASDCRQAVELISEAVKAGAALYKECRELGISKRTYNCWKNTDNDYIDKRTTCERPEPQNKMTQEEKQRILEICNSEEFASMTPGEIVPILTDRGTYVASESTFYKVLREAQLKHRGREHRKTSRPMSTIMIQHHKDMLSIFKQKGRYFYQSDFLVKILTFLSQKNQLRRFK